MMWNKATRARLRRQSELLRKIYSLWMIFISFEFLKANKNLFLTFVLSRNVLNIWILQFHLLPSFFLHRLADWYLCSSDELAQSAVETALSAAQVLRLLAQANGKMFVFKYRQPRVSNGTCDLLLAKSSVKTRDYRVWSSAGKKSRPVTNRGNWMHTLIIENCNSFYNLI